MSKQSKQSKEQAREGLRGAIKQALQAHPVDVVARRVRDALAGQWSGNELQKLPGESQSQGWTGKGWAR